MFYTNNGYQVTMYRSSTWQDDNFTVLRVPTHEVLTYELSLVSFIFIFIIPKQRKTQLPKKGSNLVAYSTSSAVRNGQSNLQHGQKRQDCLFPSWFLRIILPLLFHYHGSKFVQGIKQPGCSSGNLKCQTSSRSVQISQFCNVL